MSLASISVEIMFFTLASFCLLRLVKRKEWDYMILFLSLMVFGVTLEMMAMYVTEGYHYADFLVMIGGVPLWIGCMWAVVVYTGMRTMDLFGLPKYTRPFGDAVLAVAVDIAMDPVAVSLGLWHWQDAGNWFGVPYPNYFGWFNAVFIFSVIWRGTGLLLPRIGRHLNSKYIGFVQAALTVVLATVILGLSLLVYYQNLSFRVQEVLLLGMIFGSCGLIAVHHSKVNTKDPLDAHLIIPIITVFLFFLIGLILTNELGSEFVAIYLMVFIISVLARLVPFIEGIPGIVRRKTVRKRGTNTSED
ncbi:MAG: carotenoid biosynthesis protein [Thermoplasmata archaeon]|nr:MAG: carotenoid biosynthesis protein [Thermoplasmata archaeon]